MKIEIDLLDDQVAFLDRVAALTDTDRSAAVRRAIGQLLDELGANGLIVLEGKDPWRSEWRSVLQP